MKTHILLMVLCALGGVWATGCTSEPLPEFEERDDPEPQELVVREPIAFTDQPYDEEFTGPTSIAALRGLVDASSFVWLGLAPGDEYPVPEDCEPDFPGNQAPTTVDDLPAVIEGVVTLHPRYFVKSSVCRQDQRFYGTFFIQDATGGIMVLRDSRIATFTYGDHVRLRVRGLTKNFDTYGVMVYDDFEVLNDDDNKTPISYEEVDRAFTDEDRGKVFQVRGEVSSEATNNNFNELRLLSLTDPEVEWTVSLDRELGQRDPDFKRGDVLELTGPVINNFGPRMIIASYGQVCHVTNGEDCRDDVDAQ